MKFTKDGTAYFMYMQVSEYSDTNYAGLFVVIYKSKNPAGVRRSTQEHSWLFLIDRASVDFNANNLSRASIDTGDQLGAFGSIDLDFSQNAPLDRSCRGNVKTRAGRISGSFHFDTRTSFGAVNKRPARGRLFHQDGFCGGGGGGSPRCPRQNRSLFGSSRSYDFMNMSASRKLGADSASVSVTNMDSGSVTVRHSIKATVPGRNVIINNNLGSATVRGARGTWISGHGEFTATGDVITGTPRNCRGGMEFLSQHRAGTITGNLKGDFFIGSDTSLSDGDLNTTASKLIVRNR